jgi:hypothetical protein
MSLAFLWRLAQNGFCRRPEVEQSLSVFKGLCQLVADEALNYLTRRILMLEPLKVKENLHLKW